ncbi:MAG: hypothetical protein ACOCRO_09725 [Halanaerobiales bacterium]
MNLFDLPQDNNSEDTVNEVEKEYNNQLQKEQEENGSIVRYLCVKCSKRYPPSVANKHEFSCSCCGGRLKKIEYIIDEW